MTACPAHLHDPAGLPCVLDEGHPPGCVFHASEAPDRHDRSEAEAEAAR